MRTVPSLVFLTLSVYCSALQTVHPVWSETQAGQPNKQIVSSDTESPPLLRGIENDSFKNTPIQPNKASDGKPESAPGADAMMTPDLLFVNPGEKAGVKPEPLQAFVGQSLTIKVSSSDITLHGLKGIAVLVVNDTNRPLVIDGDNVEATAGSGKFKCAPLVAVQKSVLPVRNGKSMAVGVFTKVVPAAVTVGMEPTVKDVIRMKQPVRIRYGPDELRRMAEASRFGSRIVWPHQKTNGIVYFSTDVPLDGVKIEIPVQTLFDPSDKTLLSGLL